MIFINFYKHQNFIAEIFNNCDIWDFGIGIFLKLEETVVEI